MAIYHLSSKPISRSTGRSAVSAVAYRAGCALHDERQWISFDYAKRHGVEHSEVIAPDRQPVDRQQLWNAAEQIEKRKDARTAREYELALPAELNLEKNIALVRDFAVMLCDQQKIAVDVAIHAPSRAGDQRNTHAHLVCTTREISRTGGGEIVLGNKVSLELSDRARKEKGLNGGSKDELERVRAQWAALTNRHLAQAGETARIDHRSYKDRGIDMIPARHLCVAATAMQRQGLESERAEMHAEVRADLEKQLKKARELYRGLDNTPHKDLAEQWATGAVDAADPGRRRLAAEGLRRIQIDQENARHESQKRAEKLRQSRNQERQKGRSH